MTEPRFALKLSIHGQLPETSFADIVHLATLAEEVGFEGTFVVDHLFLPPGRLSGYSNAPVDKPYFLDAWTSLAALAQATTRLRVGPQVTPIGLRNPVFVAKAAMTVDRISDGRLILQVGAGHQQVEYDGAGVAFKKLSQRIGQLVEGIEIIRALWSSAEPVTYEGEYFSVKEFPFWPKPVQSPAPPIWLGGTSQGIRTVVAEHGDGWSPAAPQRTGLDPVFYRDALAEIRERAAGRHITGGALFYCIVSDSKDEVDGALELLRRRADWSDLGPDELRASGIALAGSPGQVVDAIGRYVEAGVEYFTVAFMPLEDGRANARSIQLFADRVMSAFRG